MTVAPIKTSAFGSCCCLFVYTLSYVPNMVGFIFSRVKPIKNEQKSIYLSQLG